MTTAPTIRTYAAAAAWLGERDDRTLYLKATRLQERTLTTIAVRYHDTDVVTYRDDGWIMLRAGGWFTNTTVARMEAFAPVRIVRRGRWWVYPHLPDTTPAWSTSHAFAEHMRIRALTDQLEVEGALDPATVKREDTHNANVRKRVNSAIRVWVAHGSPAPLRDVSCAPCVLLARGISSLDRSHFLDHVAQMYAGWLPQDTARAAMFVTGFPVNPEMISAWYVDPRQVRRLLLTGMYTGATSPTPSGRRPLDADPRTWTAWRSA